MNNKTSYIQVEPAIEEAMSIKPKPEMVLVDGAWKEACARVYAIFQCIGKTKFLRY